MENEKKNAGKTMGSPELQAAFRLGQMDMQESVLMLLAKIKDQATTESGKRIIEAFAWCVNRLEVVNAE